MRIKDDGAVSSAKQTIATFMATVAQADGEVSPAEVKMLEKRKMARRPKVLGADARIVEPVYIEDGVTITRSTVGPNVSVGKGSVLEDSTIRDSIVGDKCVFANAQLHDSLIGDEVVVRGFRGQATIGDHGELGGESGK